MNKNNEEARYVFGIIKGWFYLDKSHEAMLHGSPYVMW